MSTPNELLTKLASQWGLSVEQLIEESIVDDVAPGICTICEDYTTEVEPDCRRGHCEICGTKTVKSALVLAQLI